ncbi:MAG: type II toxin-antitoxin system RelE/ParE family toxin [Promethearchaeota archaeon]
MVNVIWSNHFLLQIDEICDYIYSDSPKYASEFVSRLTSKVSNLQKFPRIGQKVPEKYGDDLREL